MTGSHLLTPSNVDMAWCLIKEYADKFRTALKDGTIDPVKMAEMSSAERRAFLEEYVGAENAQNVNALFESKLLLKNQKAGMVSWAKRVAGMTPARKNDILTRIERLENVLDPEEGQQFLADLAASRLKVELTQEEAKAIADMSKRVRETKEKADGDGKFPSEKARFEYGAAKVALENYVNDLKLSAKKITWKEAPIRKAAETVFDTIPSISKSIMASLDNSFWGRQGIKLLLDTRTAPMWTRNFMKSWKDILGTLGGVEVMDSIKADIYSRPNAVNGKYNAANYQLDVLSEEAYPSSLPERIPLFGRLFKASEVAYNGAALRLRADLADRYIELAEKQGINTYDKEQATGIAHVVGAMTGRGSLGAVTPQTARKLNVLFFSAKFLKANWDTLTALRTDPKATPFAKKLAAQNLLSMTITLASVYTLFKLFRPDDVDEDPRSTNFGKVRLFGHWVDISGGMAGLLTLAMRLSPTKHDGKWSQWYKSASGNWIDLRSGSYGGIDAWDVFRGFFENKMSPAASLLKDIIKGEDFEGNPLTISGAIKDRGIPLPVQNIKSLIQDPNSSFIIGSIILDQLGFSTSTSIIPNRSSNTIPENTKVTEGDIISYVHTYAKAVDVDPETAFKRIFTGQKIVRVTGNTVVVERMDVKDSQQVKEDRGGKTTELKLDHTMPLQLGGDNSLDNLKLVPNATHRSYTTVENMLGRALKAGKVTKKEAQKLIIDFKEGRIDKSDVEKAIGD